MEKTYHPQSIEQNTYQQWEDHNYFQATGKGDPYCIMIPPPNVTGSLHMGHGFQVTLMDALIRFHRMNGDNTLWQVGTDHAGISTQMVVERQLAKQKSSRHDIGREQFVKKVWQWREQSGGSITQQLRRLGASCDWSREKFTMDAGLSKAVQKVFIQLYDEGLIHRRKRLVNWDPSFVSALSDIEVNNHEEQGSLWYLRYPMVDSDESVVVATTRPETMLGDAAVAVHPEDERYQHLIGKMVALPLTTRKIPVIADEYVDKEFGTGCVKITPAHDFNDYEVGMRHDLPLINIFTPSASLNEQAPKAYQGLDRFEARIKVLKDLTDLNLITKIEPHTLSVPRADRGNTIVEPYLTEQWYVKVAPLAEPAITAVKEGKVRFVPENWCNTYFQWMENIEDWCISRQLWWGHRIPAWYDDAGNIYVAEDEATVRKKYSLGTDLSLRQEEDVLDTWFSSALWPFATLDWPTNTAELKTFYPTSVLVTGFDIIFFWVARMIMMGLKFTGQVPFHEVYFTGLIRDAEGQKMSKTKGNVLDPIDLIDGVDLTTLIEKRTHGLMLSKQKDKVTKATKKEFPEGIKPHGTDALRFTFCALATTGRDIRFDLKRLEGYGNFCNKIWNASRYVLMNLEGHSIDMSVDPTNSIDQWILARLQKTIITVRQHFQDYRFDLIAQALYEFIWNEYCDWYVELAKTLLNDSNTNAAAKNSIRKTLVTVLEQCLRLLHPLMPFISEKIWQQLKPYHQDSHASIMLTTYPQVAKAWINDTVESDITWLQKVITSIRTIRSEMNVPPGKQAPLLLKHATVAEKELLAQHELILKSLAKVSDITFLQEDDAAPASATAMVNTLECLIPLAGLIDVAAEKQRLQKQIKKLESDVSKGQSKLANAKFTANAPLHVVEEEKKRLSEAELTLDSLREKLVEIEGVG